VRSASKWSPRLLRKKRVYPGVLGGIVHDISCFATQSNAFNFRPNCQFWSTPAVNSVSVFICRRSILLGGYERAGL
jgi:hypothetical protein